MPNPSQKVTTNVKTILHDIGYNRPTTVYESTSSQEVKSNNDISSELSYLYKSIIAAALFDCALKGCVFSHGSFIEVSPRVILKALQSCETTVNSENIKSHLQVSFHSLTFIV